MAKPTKAELKVERKSEWEMKAAKQERDAKVRKFATWGTVAIGFLIFLGLLVWLVSSPSSSTGSNITIAEVTNKDISTGPENSKVLIVEYADFQCPACKSFHDQILTTLIPAYKDKVKFVYRFFPLTNIHQNAMISAQAGYAASLQGKFWEMNDMLFTSQSDWATLSDSDARNTFDTYASKLGMDVDKFKKDIDSNDTKAFVTDQQNEGINAGINATPTFFLNGKQISPTSFDEFKKLLDGALKSSK